MTCKLHNVLLCFYSLVSEVAEGSSPVRVAFYCRNPGLFMLMSKMILGQERDILPASNKWTYVKTWILWEVMLMAQCSTVPARCMLTVLPSTASGWWTHRDNVSKRSGCLYVAFCECREPLTLAISTNFGYATESQFQASVVIYLRSICAPCCEYRNFHHVWFMGVIFESLWVESTIEL